MSDNGPCFNCREWQQFAAQYDFNQVTSSPLYPQANGKAEKGLNIIKQLLKKAADSRNDPYLALLSYRASPLDCGLSPAELLMGRKLRTTLPSCTRGNQKEREREEVNNKLRFLKLKQKFHYDKSSKPLKPLSPDDIVRIEDQDAWSRKATGRWTKVLHCQD